MVEESGGKFPPLLINHVKEIKKGEGKRKKKKRRRGGEGKSDRGEKEGKKKTGERKEEKIFSAFRQWKLNGPRIKVSSGNESYVCVPKSRSFIKL